MGDRQELGRDGEDAAAGYLTQRGMQRGLPELALQVRGDRHHRPRGCSPGVLRGQDPSRDGLRGPAGGHHGGEAGPDAPAGGAVARGGRRPPRTDPHRCGRVAAPPATGASRSSICAGCPDVPGAGPRGRHLRGGRPSRGGGGAPVLGLPGMSIVGLADTAVGEARDRVRAAVLNSGARWPEMRITVGLSPASLHKRGSGLDLAIALGDPGRRRPDPRRAPRGRDPVCRAGTRWAGRARCGVRSLPPLPGSAPVASRIVVAQRNAAEAGVVPGDRRRRGRVPAALGAAGHRDHGGRSPRRRSPPAEREVSAVGPAPPEPDLADVLGQPEAVAALEVAAVGGHHVSMVGRPGVGKTLLAERLPTILPDLGRRRRTDRHGDPIGRRRRSVASSDARPFQSPHHTATVAALVGGGRGGQPTPGAVTLAHAGVLFLDEAAEFGSACLESLRQPLESGVVCIARAGFTARMPARFQLVLAANPCPCGLGDGAGQECTCRSVDRRRYRAKLSGPLMDRVDIRVALGPPCARFLVPGGGRPGLGRRARAGHLWRVQRAIRPLCALGLAPALNGAQPSSLLRGPLAPDPAAADVLGAAIACGPAERPWGRPGHPGRVEPGGPVRRRAALPGAHRSGTDPAGGHMSSGGRVTMTSA